MASTSFSSIQNSFKYDVFLSFRGEDTRKNFVDHLYHALTQKGIVTYKDDENIKQGSMISDELIKAIEDSKFYIIVFSKNYASSSWCLEELVKIMECQTMDEHTAYPVFYDVEPTEVRKQSGSVGDAFAKHKDDEAASKWREALKEASDLAGFELKSIANGHEAKFIQKIVAEISLELRFINSSIDENLIGMETRVNEVLSSLEPGVGDVRMLGIWGMGGAEKTTLARAIFDKISVQFEGGSFIESVREVSKASLEGLTKLQKQVLSDVSKDQTTKVSGVSDGKSMMQKMMRSRKVLVVLDDVDHKDQLEALAGDRNWFKMGSRIIITTRDEQVLVAHRVSLIHNVPLLSQAEAGCLFSRHAFGRENRIQGYEELSGKVLEYAHGLPLTIKVLGSFLCGQSEPYWLDAIERLKTIPLEATMKRLEISFDGLENDHKEIFLDVACILKGWGKELAIRLLESRGFHAQVGLRVLEQKSLITYDEKYSAGSMHLGMHDHLEEMGRNIVRRSHPEEPQRHSRLWVHDEIEYILSNNLGTQATKCLDFRSPGFSAEIAIKGLSKMTDLRFIHIHLKEDYFESNIVQFDEVSEYLPSSLRIMSWNNFPFSSLPNTFQGKHLVGLELFASAIVQLWEDGAQKVLHKLRFLTITRSSKLRTFDLRLAPNLELLNIDRCYNLVELHIPADHHPKLKHLDLSYSKLTTFHLRSTPNLEKLILKGCRDLVEFQMPAESLKLEHLDLTDSMLTNLHFGSTPNLKILILRGCYNLVEFQMPAESLKLEHLDLADSMLTNLHFGSTPNLKILKLNSLEFQMPAHSLKLEHLELSYLMLPTFHLGNTPNLKILILRGSNDLVEFQMPTQSLKLEHLELSHLKLPTFHLGNTPNLKILKLDECNGLVEFQMPAQSLKLEHLELSYLNLTNLHLGNTPNLKKIILSHLKLETIYLGSTPKLEELILGGCYDSNLTNLHLGSIPNLKILKLDGCNDLVEFQMSAQSLKLEHLELRFSKLPTFHLGNTPNLKILILECCYDLVEFQMPAQSLKLKYLELSYLKLTNLHLGNTPNLKKLRVAHTKLKTIHLGSTPNLKILILQGCNDLVELKMPHDSLKLQYFVLRDSKLKTLHLRSTPNLEALSLEGCNDLVELQMPAESPKLKGVDLSHAKLKNLHLGNTPNLETLILAGCNDLVELQIPAEIPKLQELNLSHSKLRIFDLGLTPNLERLNLVNCYDLVDINAPVGCLRNLAFLDLSGCGSFKSFLFDRQLDSHEVGSLSELDLIAEPTYVCPLHSDNDSPKFRFECYYIEDPASSFGNIERLISIGLCACTNLENLSSICGLRGLRKLTLEGSIPEVPRDLNQLECLEELIISSTNIRNLPNSICTLNQLKSLEVVSCWLLEKLPEDFGQLQCLEKLILTDCKVLQDLPNSICKMKSLIFLHLNGCRRIMELPEEMGRLGCLKELDITRLGISYLPSGIFQLKGLRIVGEYQQLRSFGFTSEIQISENIASVTITGTKEKTT